MTLYEPRWGPPDDGTGLDQGEYEAWLEFKALVEAGYLVPVEDVMSRVEWEATIDHEAAGWAYWNEERIGSTEPDKPPFDDYRKFSGLWIERARMVVDAAAGIRETP